MRRGFTAFWMLALVGWSHARPGAAEAVSAGFIENRGQVDEAVRYYLPGSGAAVYFTPQAVVVDLKERMEPTAGARDAGDSRRGSLLAGPGPAPQTRRGCAIYVRFAGAKASPSIEARSEISTRYNYFLGNDPAKWRSEVPAHAEVIYREVWPGIDLVFREAAGALAYEAVVRPGADPADLAFAWEGIDALEPSLGFLVHERAGFAGMFRWAHPGPEPSDNPEDLLWSTFLGGNARDAGNALALDASGNVVVAGMTESSDFPVTPGAYDTSFHGSGDVFVAKFSPSGSALLWSTFLGGSSFDVCFGLALGASGNAVLTGETVSSDFPTTPGAYDASFNGVRDAFAAELSPSGSALRWSTFLGGSDYDSGLALTLDSSENAVLTGYTQSSTDSSDFPTTPGAYDTSFNGSGDAFVATFTSSGSALLWSTFLGGSGYDCGFGLALGASGNAVVTGETGSPDFPTTPGAYDTSINGGDDVFVTQLSSTGSALVGSTFLGGSELDRGYAVVLDSWGNAVVTGETRSSDLPVTPGAYDTEFNGMGDAFVAKLSATGSALLWSTFLGGGQSADYGSALVLDSSGNVVVAGYTKSTNFPTTPGAYDRSFNGFSDAFLAEISSSGNALLLSTFLGGTSVDDGNALALDSSGNAVVAGYAYCCGFPTTPGAYDASYNGGDGDAFVAKLYIGAPTSVWHPRAPILSTPCANLPNPFSEATTMCFELVRDEQVDLRIFDIRGRMVATLATGDLRAGHHDLTWPGRDDQGQRLPSGVYFLRFRAGEAEQVHRVVVVR